MNNFEATRLARNAREAALNAIEEQEATELERSIDAAYGPTRAQKRTTTLILVAAALVIVGILVWSYL